MSAGMQAAAPEPKVQDCRGYGPAVVNRLKGALARREQTFLDPRHRGVLFVVTPGEVFYVAPLPSGKVMLLARWTR